MDIAYCRNKSLLLVLDYEKGVVAFEKYAIKNATTTQNISNTTNGANQTSSNTT